MSHEVKERQNKRAPVNHYQFYRFHMSEYRLVDLQENV